MSLECAMDELAEKLGMDPVELRIRNEPAVDPRTAALLQRQLVRCLSWRARSCSGGIAACRRRPGARRALAGAAWAWPPPSAATSCCRPSAASRSSRTAPSWCARMTDIGTGTYTVLAQIAAETLACRWARCGSRSATQSSPPARLRRPVRPPRRALAALDGRHEPGKAIAELAVGDPGSPLHAGRRRT